MMDNLLIIDDEKIVLDTLSVALEDMPFEIFTADNPDEGMRLFVDKTPFLLILDMNIGLSSGLDFIEKLIEYEKIRRKSNIEIDDDSRNVDILTLKDVDFFVIVLTGYGSKKLMRECTSLGVEYFLSKPIHLHTLRGIVEKLYSLKANRNALNQLKKKSTVLTN